MCCYRGHLIIHYPNINKHRYQLYAGPHTTRDPNCGVNFWRAREGKGCPHTNVTCTNYKSSYYATSMTWQARKQAISLARSEKNDSRMLEMERQQRREE